MIRLLDLLLTSLAILALAPVFLPIVLILRLTGEGEVIYRQERIGKGGEPFKVIKFATMLKESPNLEGGFLTRKHDPRVLPVGRVLRRTKINELPQLFNVWIGNMSLVGPRPQAPVHYHLYSAEQKAAIDRQTPGVTGIGSLVFRDEEDLLERSGQDFDTFHDEIIAPYKGDLERWYAKRDSLGLYFRILLLTAAALVFPLHGVLRFFPGAPSPPRELERLLRSTDGA
ncbi:MAG: sugar transferase [Acidobacteriota bacterium]|nr:sugar transferase [Acidobacteriota bacterium]